MSIISRFKSVFNNDFVISEKTYDNIIYWIKCKNYLAFIFDVKQFNWLYIEFLVRFLIVNRSYLSNPNRGSSYVQGVRADKKGIGGSRGIFGATSGIRGSNSRKVRRCSRILVISSQRPCEAAWPPNSKIDSTWVKACWERGSLRNRV